LNSLNEPYSIKNVAALGAGLGLFVPLLTVLAKQIGLGEIPAFDTGTVSLIDQPLPLLYLCITAPVLFSAAAAVFAAHSNQKLLKQVQAQIDADPIHGTTEEKKSPIAPEHFTAALSQFIDTANVPIFGIDINGQVNEWNQQATALSGFTKSEVMGRDLINEYFPQYYKESVRELLHRALQGSETASYEFPLTTKDQRQVHILLNATTVRNFDNNIIGVIGVGQDITEEKKTQKARVHFTTALAQFIDTANAPIFGIDINGRINEWNQQATAITGYAKSDVLGRDLVYEYISDDYKESVGEVLQRALQGSDTASYEFPLTTKDQRDVHILLNANTLRDTDNNIIGVIGVGQDITDLREKNRALIQAQKMEAVGELTGGIAHDFNNLLTVIIGNLVFLRNDLTPLSSDAAESLNDALTAAQDGAELTNNLLGFSRISTLEPVTTNVTEAIKKTVGFLSRTLGENIRFITDFSELDLAVNIDSVQFDNTLLNLALNARDAMQGSGKIIISTRLYKQGLEDELETKLEPGSYVRITVTDTGQGIPADCIAHVFEPFFSTKDPGAGTGLGLSMVFGSTKQSGGSCRVDESSSHGTAISLFYPASFTVDSFAQDTNERHHKQPKDRGVILVVEDESRVRRVTTRDLRQLGYEVIEAENSKAAQHLLETEDTIDLLLSDVLMPGEMNGYQLAEWTREFFPEVKIILLSGYTSKKETKEQTARFPLIRKPYVYELLAEELETVLAGTPPQESQ